MQTDCVLCKVETALLHATDMTEVQYVRFRKNVKFTLEQSSWGVQV
jgi:hypothetical protein